MSMSQTTYSEQPMQRVLRQAAEIEDERLSAAIPGELFRPRVWRGLLGFVASYAVWGGALFALTQVESWYYWAPLWLVAGLGGWGLHCIAHDCGHGSFSKNRPFNFMVGQLALLPLLYPFHAWRHVHNLHHGNTNNVFRDTDWRPVDQGTFSRMGLWERMVYAGTRSVFFWAGTVHYQWVSMQPSLFPSRGARADVRRSNAVIALLLLAIAAAFAYAGGWLAVLKYGVGPWLGIHVWFSTTTLLHHTAEDVPFLDDRRWTRNASKLLLTTDYRYPGWLLFLTHNISIHAAHHAAPNVPFYNLPKAQEALKAKYPGLIREKPMSLGAVWKAAAKCHLYEPETGLYHSFSGRSPSSGNRAPVAGGAN